MALPPPLPFRSPLLFRKVAGAEKEARKEGEKRGEGSFFHCCTYNIEEEWEGKGGKCYEQLHMASGREGWGEGETDMEAGEESSGAHRSGKWGEMERGVEQH